MPTALIIMSMKFFLKDIKKMIFGGIKMRVFIYYTPFYEMEYSGPFMDAINMIGSCFVTSRIFGMIGPLYCVRLSLNKPQCFYTFGYAYGFIYTQHTFIWYQ